MDFRGRVNDGRRDDAITPFIHEGIRFVSVSQFMYIQKAVMAGNTRLQDLLMRASDPKAINQLGRMIKTPRDWDSFVDGFYEIALKHKYGQHPDLSEACPCRLRHRR